MNKIKQVRQIKARLEEAIVTMKDSLDKTA